MNNELKGSGQGMLALSIAGQGLSDHHYRLHSVGLVCVLSYSLSQSSEETREFGTDFPRGRDSPNIQYQHSCNPSLCFHLRDKAEKGREAVMMAVVVIMPRSFLAIKLRGDSVWEWKWLSQQKIFHFSFHFSFGRCYRLNSCHREEEPLKTPLVKMTKPSQSNLTQLWSFNLAILSMMMRPSAAAIMSEFNFHSVSQQSSTVHAE